MKNECTHCLGIDPGLAGAFALLEVSTRKILAIWDMPVDQGQVSPEGVAEIVEMAKFMVGPQGRLVGAVELVSSMPRQAGSFNFGRSAGVVHGVLGALQVPFEMIPGVHEAHGSHYCASITAGGVKRHLGEYPLTEEGFQMAKAVRELAEFLYWGQSE